MSHRVHSFCTSTDRHHGGLTLYHQLIGNANSFICTTDPPTILPSDSLVAARAEAWRTRPKLHYAPGTLSPLDAGYVEFLGKYWPTCRFYLITFVFRNGASMRPASITNWGPISGGRIEWQPDPSKYDSIFEKTLRGKLEKLAGCAPTKGQLILLVREFEHALIPGCDPTSADHIHCIVGVPSGCNHERLVRDFRKAFVPGSPLPGMKSNSRLMADVNIEELLTPTDVEKAYSYDRKKKWYKLPCDADSPLPRHQGLELDPAHRRMVKRIGEMLEVSRLKSIPAALKELGCSARNPTSSTTDPAYDAGEVVLEIDAMRVHEDSDGLANHDVSIQPQKNPPHLEKLLAGSVGRPVRAVIVERYPSGGVRRVAGDPCKWLVTQVGAEIYRLVRQDKYARAAARGSSDDLPTDRAPTQVPSEHIAPSQGCEPESGGRSYSSAARPPGGRLRPALMDRAPQPPQHGPQGRCPMPSIGARETKWPAWAGVPRDGRWPRQMPSAGNRHRTGHCPSAPRSPMGRLQMPPRWSP